MVGELTGDSVSMVNIAGIRDRDSLAFSTERKERVGEETIARYLAWRVINNLKLLDKLCITNPVVMSVMTRLITG